ncbi:MAG: hypothetical protein JW910_20170 [Anaerolineae bacterium]|nr:hypothetical protein [Anaerolineae bacterium]
MKRWRWLAVVLVTAILVSVGGAVAPVRGQGSIEVLEEEVTIVFPVSVTFTLSASSTAEINSVRFAWRAGHDAFQTQVVRVRPASSISVQVPLNAQFLSLPPFAEIAYRWQIRDADGNELTTETQVVEYADTRQNWQELDNEHIRLLWYGLDEAFAEELFAISDAAYLRLADYFGVELEERPAVVVYSDQRSFAEFQVFLLNVETVVGRYFPGHNITVNLVTPEMEPEMYETTLAHELSHLYSDNFYVGFARLPLWLEEGLATYNETIKRGDMLALVVHAAEQGFLVPFIGLPTGIRDNSLAIANLSYAEGATVFMFIDEQWGPDAVPEFLDAFRRTTSVDQVTSELFGLTMPEFELLWREWLGVPVESVPQLVPTPTIAIPTFPTPTYPAPAN